MKDQVLRILSMVQDGRLTPEDAYDLMDAFVDFERAQFAEPAPEESEPTRVQAEDGSQRSDPFRSFVDRIERLTKEASESVNWGDVATAVRTAAHKGVEALKSSVDQMGKGDFRFFWSGPYEEATQELPLHVDAGKTLRLEWTNGDIAVLGGEAIGSVSATAKVKGASREEAKSKAESWTLVLEEHDGNVTIRQSPDTVAEDLKIRIPTGVNVDVRLDNGSISVADTNAGLKVAAQHGDLKAKGLTGSVDLNVTSGDVSVSNVSAGTLEVECRDGQISLDEVEANVRIRSTRGGVRAKAVASSSVSIETVDGTIDLDLAKPLEGTLNLRSVSGDILIDVASGSSCRVGLSSLSSEVKCDLELQDDHRSRERITGRIGSGAGTLDASSVSGRISLRQRNHA